MRKRPRAYFDARWLVAVLVLLLVPSLGRAVKKVDGSVFLPAFFEAAQNDHNPITQAVSDGIRRSTFNWELQPLYERAVKDETFHYGSVNFHEMFREFDKVHFYYWGPGRTVQVSSSRPSDIYLRGKYVVILNHDFETGPDMGRAGLVLHTLLGAIGYNDENYQLTTAMYIAAICLGPNAQQPGTTEEVLCKAIDFDRVFPQTHDELVLLAEDAERKILYSYDSGKTLKILEDGGGFTGVGGGGDYRALMIKMGLGGFAVPEWRRQVLSAECASQWKDANEFMREFLPLKIEASDSVKELKFLALPKDRSLRGLSVMVPASTVNDRRATGEALLAIIKKVCAIKAGQP